MNPSKYEREGIHPQNCHQLICVVYATAQFVGVWLRCILVTIVGVGLIIATTGWGVSATVVVGVPNGNKKNLTTLCHPFSDKEMGHYI